MCHRSTAHHHPAIANDHHGAEYIRTNRFEPADGSPPNCHITGHTDEPESHEPYDHPYSLCPYRFAVVSIGRVPPVAGNSGCELHRVSTHGGHAADLPDADHAAGRL